MEYPRVKHLYKYRAYNERSMSMLENNRIWIAKGDAQIYMIIDKNKKLESIFYEIYYPRFH